MDTPQSRTEYPFSPERLGLRSDGKRRVSETLRCHCCGEVIGVYEPLVTLIEGRPYETSRALAPDTVDSANDCYHRACYERLDNPAPIDA